MYLIFFLKVVLIFFLNIQCLKIILFNFFPHENSTEFFDIFFCKIELWEEFSHIFFLFLAFFINLLKKRLNIFFKENLGKNSLLFFFTKRAYKFLTVFFSWKLSSFVWNFFIKSLFNILLEYFSYEIVYRKFSLDIFIIRKFSFEYFFNMKTRPKIF